MTTERKQQLNRLFIMAWQFIKSDGLAKSDALKTAWKNVRLRKAMVNGIAEFKYIKVDGSTRTAHGTIYERPTHAKRSSRKNSNEVQIYFDIDCQAWRSFRKVNLL